VERRNLPRDGSLRLDRASAISGASLVQAAMRRRIAERAFEDYVREMARRWTPPPQGDGPGAGDVLPKV
jgi:hypothetical protein